MKLLEYMERTGIREPERAKVYITDALYELQSLIPDKTTGQKYNVVDGQRLYSWPSNMVRLLGVYRIYDRENGHYVRIPSIQRIDLLDELTSTATNTEADIIVV